MGTYTALDLAGYPIVFTKSAVDPCLMTLFRESDRQECARRLSDRNPEVWGTTIEEWEDEDEDAVLYRCSVNQAIDRLNIMGFTLRRARAEYEDIRRSRLDELREGDVDDEDTIEWQEKQRATIEAMDFEAYSAALSEAIERRLQPFAVFSDDRDRLSGALQYLLDDDHYEHYMGFFCTDIRSLIRIACEHVPADGTVIQDITDLISAGYYRRDERVCEEAIDSLAVGHTENAMRIVLTEGSTDREFLHRAMRVLYPHLAEYYTFFDFEGTNSPGSVGHLVNLVKAFAAAGVTNRVVALFDNDAAAADAIRSLSELKLPDNIAVLTYPDSDSLCLYPTIGPQGLARLDVNGRAASIELYLGADCLATPNGDLSPIQWTGYTKAIDRYQGEIIDKRGVHLRFREKLNRIESGRGDVRDSDWSGIRAILESVFSAFD